jgi:hypothetical protein
MSLSEPVFEALGQIVWAVFFGFWSGQGPKCYGDLRWMSFWGKEKRIRCVNCHRQWVKGSKGRWEIDVPLNAS